MKDLDTIFMEVKTQSPEEAFKEFFGFSPGGISCECCGQDYSIIEYENLEEATEFDRRRNLEPNGEKQSVHSFLKLPGVRFVSLSEQKREKAKYTMSAISKKINKNLEIGID